MHCIFAEQGNIDRNTYKNCIRIGDAGAKESEMFSFYMEQFTHDHCRKKNETESSQREKGACDKMEQIVMGKAFDNGSH